MSRELFFNELSGVPVETRQQAQSIMKSLVETIQAGWQAGGKNFRAERDLGLLVLSEGYSVRDWRNDPAVGHGVRSMWRSMQARSPILRADTSQEERGRLLGGECSFEGRSVIGLGAAAQLGGLAVSLAGNGEWLKSKLSVVLTELVDDDIVSSNLDVFHAASVGHVKEHAEWLTPPLYDPIDADDLWNRREDVYPALVFCAHVKKAIDSFGSGTDMFKQVKARLLDLQNFFSTWDGKVFDPEQVPFKVTPDSPTQLKKYPEERTFMCPDAVMRLFRWKTKLPNGHRLYFYPQEGGSGAIIGDIGPHKH